MDCWLCSICSICSSLELVFFGIFLSSFKFKMAWSLTLYAWEDPKLKRRRPVSDPLASLTDQILHNLKSIIQAMRPQLSQWHKTMPNFVYDLKKRMIWIFRYYFLQKCVWLHSKQNTIKYSQRTQILIHSINSFSYKNFKSLKDMIFSGWHFTEKQFITFALTSFTATMWWAGNSSRIGNFWRAIRT